ncbi:MAG: anti-sigma F factor [Eubacteriales bacterium]|nr:anti-sigma F factor [Eubacteriales bacterium]
MREIVNGMTNEMKLEFDSRSANEAFARVTVASFMTQLNPTLEEVSDVKTAVSEAVTNAIIHGYENHVNKIRIFAGIEGRTLRLEISDRGVGIPDVKKAMEPLFTTKPEMERSGMGFSFMEAFMDEVTVESEPGKGTIVRMKKVIGKGRELWTTQSL